MARQSFPEAEKIAGVFDASQALPERPAVFTSHRKLFRNMHGHIRLLFHPAESRRQEKLPYLYNGRDRGKGTKSRKIFIYLRKASGKGLCWSGAA
jgi:hypothetical protein